VVLCSRAKVDLDLHPRVSLGFEISVAFGLYPQQHPQLNSEIKSFTSTLDKPCEENVSANLVQQSSSSISFIDFKVVELSKNPNILLNVWSSSNLLFNDVFAISIITKK
jgi:hypothetical protein